MREKTRNSRATVMGIEMKKVIIKIELFIFSHFKNPSRSTTSIHFHPLFMSGGFTMVRHRSYIHIHVFVV